ncbi:hypothetical protein [Parabacteroides sp. AF18-52]|nr:hypothetical protein [Parabacteroides sp. AF18-52]
MAKREIEHLHLSFVNNCMTPINKLAASIDQMAKVRRDSQIQNPST